jgi:polar amino acid transport system substrate-binding protein
MVPDEVVADIQGEIDRLKDNGYLRKLSQQYLNTSDYPGTLQVYTEEYPPLTFMTSFGEVSGFGSDVVFEIMDRNKVFAPVKLSTWSNSQKRTYASRRSSSRARSMVSVTRSPHTAPDCLNH